ncbi:hypothetical protein OSB04_019537 [Centaurea solstitialis]|uniref:Integrase catalytic domain-containing protein n=1 Tax=Centaurea solstitialis TaxID=347529 RepID=A0AA38WED1_9ASTR|nr:hypothetical protein OSB04_019537 [Centaurea solstitialis]
MTGTLELLSSYVNKEGSSVAFGGNQKGRIKGYGMIVKGEISINQVSYVDGLKHNLISVSQLCDNGLDVMFKIKYCIMYKTDTLIEVMRANRRGDLYLLCFTHLKLKKKYAWSPLRRMKKHGFGIPACEMGKLKRSSHKTKSDPSYEKPLQLLHVDLCGPIAVQSLGEKKYILVLIDEFSRYTWVRVIRSDNGTEFTNSTIEDYLTSFGITHNISTPRTPQKNRVVERKNRTLVEAARTMLNTSGLPLSFWAEAVSTACYTQNRSLVMKHFEKTPYQLLYNKRPNIKFFHIFGCKCYVLNDKEPIWKFDPKGDDAIFVGYAWDSVIYRVYIPRTQPVVVSSNVNIDDSFSEWYEDFEESNRASTCIDRTFNNVDRASSSNARTSAELPESPSPTTLYGPSQTTSIPDVPTPITTSSPTEPPESLNLCKKSLQINLAYTAYRGFKVYQMDVKSAFLNGKLKELYVKQPPGFESGKYPNHVYCLDKALYGLKQAPEHVYVDDIIFGSTDVSMCKKFESLMQSEFEMSMMGELTFFLGLQVKQSSESIFINQAKYVQDLLKKYKLSEVFPMRTPMATGLKLHKDLSGVSVECKLYRSMIGSLLYLTASRPDIMFATCLCARFQANPKESHLSAVKRIMRYLKKTPSLRLRLWRMSSGSKEHFWELSIPRRNSKKQNCVSTSTAEAEYVAAANCCSQALWMQTQLHDYGYTFDKIPILCDSKSAIAISVNPVQHSKTKHINIRYHFLKHHVEEGNVEMHFVSTEYQLADLFTTALDEKRFNFLVKKIGMSCP